MTMVWLNGEIVPESEARISPFDHGILVGDGVFETVRVVRGRPFAARRHLERLAASAGPLGIVTPEAAVLRSAMAQVVTANHIESGRLRITLTSGVGPLGSERGGEQPTVVVTGGEENDWPEITRVVTVPWSRNERGALAGLKTISYADNVRALALAREQGATEAIFPNTAGRLCEGTGTNVFVVADGRVVTPGLESGCLAGVTRALLLEITSATEADLPIEALAEADEAFLTSTTRDVHPISHVDGVPLPRCPGPLTTASAEAFAALVARDVDP